MAVDPAFAVPPGWVGGFAQSDPAFAYPDPDLSSLPMLGNMDNIDKLQRQQKVLWPEFSWETVPGDAASRCFQMFAPDISRIGYDDEGRVYSIICPQQGTCSASLGCLNVEVSVTGQRGWVDEPERTLAADMTVAGKIWFTPSAKANPLVKFLWALFADNGLPFPADKARAIQVSTHRREDPSQPVFPVRKGQTELFESPAFALHDHEAWTVGNVEVEIGPIARTGDEVVDGFNQLVMDVFNISSGNLLLPGNLLTWNVWFTEPSLVDQQEWRGHAEKWRKSIEADHGSPEGEGTPPRYFDGTPFTPSAERLERETDALTAYLTEHLEPLSAPRLTRMANLGS
ncbi:hypothetical protein [Ornithinimicrobium cryptoxanthini]|uniref:Aromatic ring-hydroxylating dioxygenase subunit alpha n=1 Tax=Ornithinimicrobium cryptoxanthini TaxID=2934161 RepID=A0ABY4YMF6_9MICO|nr:hypothetical protein [Ornithinimicrobium cryptoxanthini]USQ77337.1 hypothetical protein NF557_05340 [Ornithinimicrobium cryptoxanthini]